MKLSSSTVSLLKNMASINSNILIEPGSKLRTKSISGAVMSTVEVKEAFPIEFPIYNLGEFLSVLSLFNDPDLEFKEKNCVFTETSGANSSKLVFAAASKEILVYPTKDPVFPAVDVSFSLTEEQLGLIQKASAIISAPDLIIDCASNGVTIKVGDRKGKVSNAYTLKVQDTCAYEGTFVIKIENLKLIPGLYNVSISAKGISMFESPEGKGTCFILLEA
jgi:hypothetical protein